MTLKSGQNCGQHGKSEAIFIDNISAPDTLILGANATFSAEVTVNSARKSASLLSVVMQKVGLPFDIPCTSGESTYFTQTPHKTVTRYYLVIKPSPGITWS